MFYTIKLIKKHGKDLSSNDFTDGYKKKLDSIEKIYKFKGNVSTYTELSVMSASNGDVYNVLDEGNNYAWNGTEWIELGFIIDMSEFAYQEEIDEIKSAVNENAEEIDKLKTYSTEEQVIGTWIDGRPLYRKMIFCNALPNATAKHINSGLDSSCKVVKMYGYSKANSSENLYIPLPFVSPTANESVGINMWKNNITISTGIDRSNYTESCVTLEYIKTTD